MIYQVYINGLLFDEGTLAYVMAQLPEYQKNAAYWDDTVEVKAKLLRASTVV